MNPAYESDAPATTPPLPDIPECDIERTPEGIKLTHRESGQTTQADDTERDPIIKGIMLRVVATWRKAEPTFRTGDIP